MKITDHPSILGADEVEPLQQTIEVSSATMTDHDNVMTKLRDRFGLGDY